MFNSLTKYRQRRTQTKEHANVLTDVVLTVLEPHYNNFLNTVEPTLRSMGDDVLFRAPIYYETQEAHEALIEAIYATTIPADLKLSNKDIATVVYSIRWSRILEKVMTRKMNPPSFGGFTLGYTLDGITVTQIVDLPKWHKAYLKAVAKNLHKNLKQYSVRREAALAEKYALELSSENKEPLACIGRFSAHVSADK